MTDIAGKFMGSQKNGAAASNSRAVSRSHGLHQLQGDEKCRRASRHQPPSDALGTVVHDFAAGATFQFRKHALPYDIAFARLRGKRLPQFIQSTYLIA